MPCTRSTLLSALAVFCVSAVAPAAASAACPETGVDTLCIKGVPAAAGNYAFTGKTIGESNLKMTSLGLSMDSASATATGNLVQGTVLATAVKARQVVFKFKSLTMLEPTTCTPPTEIKTVELLAAFSDPIGKATFEPESGSAFTSFTLSGVWCPATLKGVHTLSGTQEATLIAPEKEAVTHELEAVEKSGLLYGGEKEANLKSKAELELSSKEAFSIQLA